MDPLCAAPPPLRMRLIHLHARDVHLLHGLLMMGVCAVGRHTLEAVDGLEIYSTNVRRPLITDTPPLTLQQLYHGRCWQLAPRHQGAFPLGELPGAQGAAQPFDVPGLAGPGAMRNIACAGAIALCTVWMRARESSISLWRWRRPYHSGPPVAGNGPKDTEPTPVMPRYCSPGLPFRHHTPFFCSMVTWNCTGISISSFKRCSKSLSPNWKRLKSQRFLRCMIG